jgi:hypothetical protein
MTTAPPGFTVIRELGAGRLGSTALCRDPGGVEVVVTVLGARPADEAARQELESELAAAAAAFGHPCAVLSALVTAGDSLWLQQPYLVGGPLGSSPVDANTAATGGTRLTAVLAQGHAAGMLHGDVRPANVLLDGDGAWHLAGGGVAHAAARVGVVASPAPLFAAPESFSGEQLGAAADVYSLGATLYAALVGTAPHADAARGGAGALYSARLGPPPELPRSVPVTLAALVRRMLAPDPAERPTLVEVDQVLRGLAPAGVALLPPIRVREEPAAPRPAVRLVMTEPAAVAAASKRRTLIAAAAIGAVFIAGAGAVAATSGDDKSGVELAAGSAPTVIPTPSGSPSTAAPAKPRKRPAKVTQPTQVQAPASVGLPVELLVPNSLELSPDFYKGEWVLLASFKMDAIVDSVRGWKMIAKPRSGAPITNFYDASDERVAGIHRFRFLSNVPLTACVTVVTDIGQAATDDHLYKSEKKCMTESDVRTKQANFSPRPSVRPDANSQGHEALTLALRRGSRARGEVLGLLQPLSESSQHRGVRLTTGRRGGKCARPSSGEDEPRHRARTSI